MRIGTNPITTGARLIQIQIHLPDKHKYSFWEDKVNKNKGTNTNTATMETR